MADKFLSLLDVTARQGTDAAVGLVEEVVTYAPEFERIMGRPIPGTSYKARVRASLHGNAGFRKANVGVEIGGSRYIQKRFDTYFADAQLQVDEADARAAEADGDSLSSLQADEASGAMRAMYITIGSQVYKGTANQADGFPGLTDFLSSAQTVDAGGSGAGACERAWFIWMDPQGVHFLWGARAGLDMKPWTQQQVKDATGKSLMAYVSNISGYIGLSCANVRAVGCIRNIDNTLTNGAEAKPLTDKLIADVLAKFPVGIQPNMIFMSRATRAGLQKQRTKTESDEKTGLIAPVPTEAQGVPIVATDSIPLENQVS